MTDVKRLTNYFRVVPGNRLLFGGRGGASINESPAIARRLHKEMSAIFPQLSDIKSDYSWSGRVAVTLNGIPKIGSLSERVHYAVGYNGRGVALATYLGSALARMAAGEDVDLGPLSSSPFEQIPFYGQRHVVKPGVTGWAQVRYSYGASVEDAIEKMQYDLYYVKHMSLMFDLMIALETIKTVVLRRGAK